MVFRTAFFAYPGAPSDLRTPIDTACEAYKDGLHSLKVTAWPQLEAFGAVIPDEIRDQIDAADILYADVTLPNFNVYYEIGFAIGRGKVIAPVINRSFANAVSNLQSDGLFDTIGYKQYESSLTLKTILSDTPNQRLGPLHSRPVNHSQPIFVLETLLKTDFRNAIVSAVKDTRVFYRSFDPVETPRFASVPIIGEASSSVGIIVPFLGNHVEDYLRHNLRAAFLAGLGHGLGRQTLLLQLDTHGSPAPADYRDLVKSVRSEEQIVSIVAEFVKSAMVSASSIKTSSAKKSRTALQKLSLGAIAAENEFRNLDEYFVETSEYVRTQRGEISVISGRKGSGKTAIFFMVRDNLREKRNYVVTDLKPESHQLSMFRESLVSAQAAGIFDHTLAAFWYFVVLSEIALTLKLTFEMRSKYDGRSAENAIGLKRDLAELDISSSGDFTSRISKLGQSIVSEIERIRSKGEKLSPERLTNIVFKQDASKIRELIYKYSERKSGYFFLFDNIDKGWPANGVHDFDVRMVRLLIEALEKIKRDFHADNRVFNSTVFLRNDIYELLVEQTPDRGKIAAVRIDWTDRLKLRQVIHLRLKFSTGRNDDSFSELWNSYFSPVVDGIDSFEYCIDHCMMRPRFLINIIENAISHAINRGNTIATEDDIRSAILQHSHYLVNDFGFEIRDVSGLPADILYSLIGVSGNLTETEVVQKFKDFGVSDGRAREAFQLMLWYGVIGISLSDGTDKFIYDYDYNPKRLSAQIRSIGENNILYIANKALNVALSA